MFGGKENTKVTNVTIITIIPSCLWKQEERKTKVPNVTNVNIVTVPNVTNVTIVTIILGCLIQEKQSAETMPVPNVTNVTNVTIILGCFPKLGNLTVSTLYLASYALEIYHQINFAWTFCLELMFIHPTF